MNILQILPELHVGGVETGTLDLAKYLVKLGHKVVVVSHGGELVEKLEAYGGIHYQLPVHKKSFFTMWKTVPRLAEIIKKEEIEIVHARSRVPAWIAYFAARKTHRIFITTCHGYYTKHPFSYVMGWARRVIVLSNVIGRHMIDDFGVPHDRIRMVPRSVDLERFRYVSPETKRKKDFTVGIIGRLTPIKGHLDFIKAMARAARSIPHLKIWIVGDAPASKESYKEQVQILVRRLGLWHCTQFLGTQRDIPAVISNLDLLILATTTQEAFGRVIVEAQASGVPVIATRVGGAVDIIEEGKTGLLVPPSDPAAMADASLRIFKDPGLAAGMAQAAYKKVLREYNVEKMVESTLTVYREAMASHEILIIKLGSLGDVILSGAAIRAIRKKFPGHKITVLVGKESKDFLLGCPYIDELMVCDFKNNDKGMAGLLKLGARLRQRDFDIVIDLQNNRKSHLLAFLSGSLKRYGYDNKKFGFLLTQRIKDEKNTLDPLAHQFRILKMLEIELEDRALEFWTTPEDRDYVESFLKSAWISPAQKIIGINISASEKWATKNWPLHHLIKLCEDLGRRDIRVVITGTEKESRLAENLINSVKSAKPINACGKTTINQLACLIKRCNVYIASDSAPMHIAAGMGTPLVALFGPTDPKRHFSASKEGIAITKELLCSPCYKSQCRHKNCMESIKPEEVLKAVDRLLLKDQ